MEARETREKAFLSGEEFYQMREGYKLLQGDFRGPAAVR